MKAAPKSALVTGARGGIGAAVVRALAAQGMAVGVGVRRKGDGKDSVKAAVAAGGQAAEIVLDLSEDGAPERAVAKCEAAFGGLDILVNNAGAIEPIRAIPDIEPSEFALNLKVNVVGAFALARASWPMLRKSRGRILNILSGASRTPFAGWSAYCASKAAMLMLTESLDMEGRAEGIRCFGFAPGVVDTDMQGVIRASGVNHISQLPREALAHPDIPGKAAAWLVSGEADDLAGQYVDISDPHLRQRSGLSS